MVSNTLAPARNGDRPAWARTLRDTVADLVASDLPIGSASHGWDVQLMGYSTEALRDELGRRHDV